MLDAFALDFRRADEADVQFIQPLSEAAKRFKRVRLMRFDDNADAFDGGHHRSASA